ncbi:LysR family transcriptional regulator [Polaromonas sp. SM01]|uniref:LysR family transcriptional regulator n=1 Tax=Polaromonas sp. SM01 TaxID=3085630 RepID=UPI0029817339|nr:LysR family transcriptional regulator [Polaromonas sp. SM01]MDW5441129.1 LysR family transcriptional regulator [Polaromonas sp. SM01]
MDIRTIDMNLLVVFDAMTTHRNVTRAGEAIGLSQPAMSAAVARLRGWFDDPLFVKTGAEMKPTPRALELAGPVRRVIDTVKGEILQRSGFDPATTDRTFTLITPDIGEVNFVPKLLARMSREAPQAQLRTVAKSRPAAAEALESGAADLAIGYFPDLQKAGFFQQKLFGSAHVCIVRSGHPTVGERLTLREYMALSHAVVRPDGREHVFEQFFDQRGLKRRVVLELSHFMSLLPVIESSDLMATVPRDLADVCRRYGTIRVLETPIKSPVIAVHQFWHRRVHKDPANLWLRSMVQALFTTSQT